VLFPSTIASFGALLPKDQQPPNGQVLNESVQVPQTFYGAAKVACERLGEQYHRKGWVDFRAVRFPSVIGAGRGPGGTTVYSTLMIQEPAIGNSYSAYVPETTQLDVLYVKDAARALRELHDADGMRLTRRVYNINGIRSDGQVPTARQIADAVGNVVKHPKISFTPDQELTRIVTSFGVLDGSAAQTEWEWKLHFDTLDKAVQDFVTEIKTFPHRLQRLDLFGG
jgi:nucleoside-diphosphate-sugar epimerase